MERLSNDKQKHHKQEVKPPVVPLAPITPQESAHPCPLCRAAGREYSRRGYTQYIKCTSCGHTWTEKPLPGAVEVAYRTTEIRTR